MDKKNRNDLVFILLIFIVNMWYYRNYFIFQNKFPAGIDFIPFISRLHFYQDYDSYFYIWRNFSFGHVEFLNIDNIIGLLPLDPILSSKLAIFIFTLIAGISTYFLSFHYIKSAIFSFLASYIYISNQYLFVEAASGHIYVILYYSLLPLIVFLYIKVLDNRKFVDIIKFSLLLTVAIFFSRGEAIFSYAIVLGIISLVEIISSKRIDVLSPITYCIFLFILFGSIWLIPYIFSVSPTYIKEGGFNYPIEEHKNFALGIFDTIAGHGREFTYLAWTYGLAWNSHPFLDYWKYKMIMIMIPILSFSAMLFRKIDKITLSLSLMALLSIFLAKGPNEPFGNIYFWLYDNIPFFNSLRVENRLLTVSYLSYSLLIGITLRNIKVNNFRLGTVLLIIVSIFIVIYPILANYPVSVQGFLVWAPDESVISPYKIINNDEYNGEYRVLTIPYQYISNTTVFSSSSKWRTYDLGTFSNIWHKKPVANQMSWNSYANYFQKYYLYSIFFNKTDELMKLSGLANIKYIFINEYPEDMLSLVAKTKEYGTINDAYFQHRVIKNQKGLKKLTVSNNTTIYENEYFLQKIFSTENSAIVIGGRESIVDIIKLSNISLDKWNLLFADQIISENKKTSFFNVANRSDAIIFVNSEPVDIAMLILDNNVRVRAAEYSYPSTNSKKYWIGSDMATKSGMFVLNSKMLSTSGNNNISIQIKLEKESNYEVWVRSIYDKNVGKLSLDIDNNSVGNIVPYSQIRNIKWTKLGNVTLDKGRHSLLIKNEKSVYGVTNDIDEIVLVEHEELMNRISEVNELLRKSDRIVFITEMKETIDTLTKDLYKNNSLEPKFQLLESDGHLVFYYQKDNEKDAKFSDIFQTNISPTETNFTKISSIKYSVHIKTNDPFFLIFSDSYHPLWKAYIDNKEIEPIVSYSFINGFYIQDIGEYDVTIEFVGQRYIWIGSIISLMTIISTIGYTLFRNRS